MPQPALPAVMGEFWEDVDPRTRELFYGMGGRQIQPHPDVEYEFVGKDTSGFSTSYDVRDPSGIEWSVKIGDEAQTEVTASRLVWAMGYHQPPIAYLPKWVVRDGSRVRVEGGGRFRPKLPTFESAGTWSWYKNPFVGTQAYRGLLVLMMLINSTDLKEENNVIYERREEGRPLARWYVVKDLGATFGTTGRINPARNDVEAFEQHGFLEDVDPDRVRFAYRGRHQALLRQITPADVAWMCNRLSRLSTDQWRDAFRAGGYDDAVAARYIRRLEEKIAEGRAVGTGNPTPSPAGANP